MFNYAQPRAPVCYRHCVCYCTAQVLLIEFEFLLMMFSAIVALSVIIQLSLLQKILWRNSQSSFAKYVLEENSFPQLLHSFQSSSTEGTEVKWRRSQQIAGTSECRDWALSQVLLCYKVTWLDCGVGRTLKKKGTLRRHKCWGKDLIYSRTFAACHTYCLFSSREVKNTKNTLS